MLKNEVLGHQTPKIPFPYLKIIPILDRKTALQENFNSTTKLRQQVEWPILLRKLLHKSNKPKNRKRNQTRKRLC